MAEIEALTARLLAIAAVSALFETLAPEKSRAAGAVASLAAAGAVIAFVAGAVGL